MNKAFLSLGGILLPGHRCYGVTGLEAHDAIAEYAGLNETDWRKVAADFPLLGINSEEDWLKAAESEGSLLILCDEHHRSPHAGIHSISYPTWLLDRYAVDDWEFLAEDGSHEPAAQAA
jgi:hypothetical protein